MLSRKRCRSRSSALSSFKISSALLRNCHGLGVARIDPQPVLERPQADSENFSRPGSVVLGVLQHQLDIRVLQLLSLGADAKMNGFVVVGGYIRANSGRRRFRRQMPGHNK